MYGDAVHVPFSQVVANYRAVFFDAYGVLKNAQGVIAGVSEVLARLEAQGKQIFVLTNDASRPPALMSADYDHPDLGPLVPEPRVISSGHLATEFLQEKVPEGRVAYLGPKRSTHFIEAAGLTPVPVSQASPDDELLAALVLLDDEGFDWFEDLNRAVNLVRRRNIPVVVANADLSYPVDDHDVGVAIGSLALMMERIVGKQFIRFGKPDAMMFNYAYERVRAQFPDIKKAHILMVGDTLHTDIVGANKFGFDTALVLTGNTLPQRAATRIDATGIIPTYICESVLT